MNTTTINAERIARLEEIVAELDEEIEALDEVRAQLHSGKTFSPECILLVEECNLVSAAGTHAVSLHGQLGDAGDYNVGQECASDWPIAFAVNLDTGARYTGTYRVVWEDA